MKMRQVLYIEKIFYNITKDKKLPSRVAYRLSLFINKIAEHTKFYYERLEKILEEYAERDSEGKVVTIQESGHTTVKIKKNKIKECEVEIEEIQELEVELEGLSLPIKDLENLELTVEEISILSPFLTE